MLGVVWGLGLRPGFGLLNRVSCDQLHVPKHCRGGGWGVRGGGGGGGAGGQMPPPAPPERNPGINIITDSQLADFWLSRLILPVTDNVI